MLGIRLAKGGRGFAASRLVCRTAFFGDADCNRVEAGPPSGAARLCGCKLKPVGPILAFPSGT